MNNNQNHRPHPCLPNFPKPKYFATFGKGGKATRGQVIEASSYASGRAVARAMCGPFEEIIAIYTECL